MSEGFRDVLVAEILWQRTLRKRMGDDHPARGIDIMWQIRMERLELLEKLMEFERDPSGVPPHDAPQ